MDLNELRIRVQKLEGSILDELKGFEDETGCVVTDIHFDRVTFIGEQNRSVIFTVKVKVDLRQP